jgi:hypothetical protein
MICSLVGDPEEICEETQWRYTKAGLHRASMTDNAARALEVIENTS